MDKYLTELEAVLPKIISILPAALAAVAGAIVVNFMIGRGLKLLAHKSSFSYRDIAPLHRAARWLVFAATVVLLLEIFGINLGGVWAMLSTVFALIGVGFIAVWSVLSNTLCTFVILIFHPFAVGDEIEFTGEPVRGKVIDLNFIYTTVRSDDGSDLQIPNNLFFQKVLKRRHGGGAISLATQLNSRKPAAF